MARCDAGADRSAAARAGRSAAALRAARTDDRHDALCGVGRAGSARASARARRRELVVTGSETDVCVLATVLGAVDAGYRVILVRDAGCSSSDEGHDALLALFGRRFSEQIEVVDS